MCSLITSQECNSGKYSENHLIFKKGIAGLKSFHQFTRPIVIAHRGASADAPENTLAAFNRAIDLNADAVEMDVKLSYDKEVVVIHDRTVDRTTNGTGFRIRSKWWAMWVQAGSNPRPAMPGSQP